MQTKVTSYQILSKVRFGYTITLSVQFVLSDNSVLTKDISVPVTIPNNDIQTAISNTIATIENELGYIENAKTVYDSVVLNQIINI